MGFFSLNKTLKMIKVNVIAKIPLVISISRLDLGPMILFTIRPDIKAKRKDESLNKLLTLFDNIFITDVQLERFYDCIRNPCNQRNYDTIPRLLIKMTI